MLMSATFAGRMDLGSLPAVFQSLDLQSVMIEGGANIIRQLLETTITSANGGVRPLADTVIVTVAPVTVGSEGTGYGMGDGLSSIQSRYGNDRHTEKLGKDTILVYKA
jgi:2,5-diamino-6-(ribosylamino)-4(3H)-pyrimidinone 5'-phosphate reductase